MTTALFIGRFQPFHLGHLKVLEWAADRNDKLLVGIGSSQEQGTEKNPFSFEQRKQMIETSMKIDQSKYEIYPVPDINDPPNWVKHVKDLLPHFDVVYTNSDLERELFKKAKYAVVVPPYFARKKYKATDIRRSIKENGNWRQLVPEGTRKVIEEVGGEEKIKELS
ncbi:MAG: nicotinamide-nucleotide adenylyltransferase [Candidatus Altiarchaeota archaeon]